MTDNYINISCPNCSENINIARGISVKCPNLGCDYSVMLFNKDEENEANIFYSLTPSKQLKFKFIVFTNYIAVAYCQKSEPFKIDNIFDLIEPEALRTIQIGLSERLKIPMSIYVYFKETYNFNKLGDTVELLRRDEGVFGRINPIPKNAYHCDWCKNIRNTAKGEQLCTQCDCQITYNIFKSTNPTSSWRRCWSGLIDFAIPVVINNLVVAVFTCGQIKLEQEENIEFIQNKIRSISDECNMPFKQLISSLDSNTQYRANSIEELNIKLQLFESHVKLISTIVENRYWAERDLSDSVFLSEVYSSFAALEDSSIIWDVVEMVLNRINDYSNFNYSAVFISDKKKNVFDLKAKSENILNVSGQIELNEPDLDTLFMTEKLFVLKDSKVTFREKIYSQIINYLNIKSVNSLLLFTFKLDELTNGFIVFADRRSLEGQVNPGVITTKRRLFMEKMCHEIRIEVYNSLNKANLRNTIEYLNKQKNKIEKAEKIREHETKAPLASIIANATFVLTNINESAATSKARRLREIISDTEICAFLFKEIKIPSTEEFLKGLTYVSPGIIIEDVVKFIQREIERRSKMTIKENSNMFEYDFEIFPNINIVHIGSTSRSAIHPYLLKRAFYNLSINSVKYSIPKNGELKIFSSEKGGNIIIAFEDNGIGIDEQEAHLIFNDGFRGTNVKNKYNGEGMGLKITKEIIEAHSGTIKLTSLRNPTKFEIVIPHKTISKDFTSIDHHIIRKDIFTRY